MDAPSPAPLSQIDTSARAWSAARRSSRERSSWRAPHLCLHISGGQLSWAVVSGAVIPELVSAGSLRVEQEDLARTLVELVVEQRLPCSGARLAVPGAVRLVDAGIPSAPVGSADIALADGRRIRAEIDPVALAAALAACASAGIEVVSVEPEALPLARALAGASPAGSPVGRSGPRSPTAAVWVADSCTVVVRSCGDEVELLGLVPAGSGTAPYLVAPAAARLIASAGADIAKAVVAGGEDPADLAERIAFATSLPVRVGDPLSRIPVTGSPRLDAVAAAGAIGLGVETRGLPRVEIPVRSQPGTAVPPAAAPPDPAEPEAVALSPPGNPGAGLALAAAPLVAPDPDPDPEPATGPAPGPAPEHRAASRALTVAVSAVVVVAVLVGGWATVERGAVRDREAVLATLQTQLAAIPSPTAPTRRLLVLGADRRARVDAIASALGNRIAWDRILREVSAVLPADVWLTGVVARAGPGSDDLRLRGFAADQAGVALALTRLALVPDLGDVRLERSERSTQGDRPIARFSIVAAVREEAR